MEDVAGLANDELIARLERLVAQERGLTAQLLEHMGEVDQRGLFRGYAFSSMFEYAVEALHMSENEAFLRIRAARLARNFPVILGMLESNELHLTAIKLLGPHLTDANHLELLQRARHLSRTEVEKLVAELAPKPDVASTMRKLPGARPAARPPLASPAATPVASMNPNAPARTDSRVAGTLDFRLDSSPSHTTALSPGRYKVQFTASQALHDKLAQLRDLMRHQVPDGDLATLVERAADLMIVEQRRRRFAQVKRPRTEVASEVVSRSRYVPRAVVRAVHARDEEQCTFVAADGRRCAARGMLELHHVHAFAKGGAASVGNLRVVCRAHNALFAELEFGSTQLGLERRQV